MIGFAFPAPCVSGVAGFARWVVQASFRLPPFEPLIWLNELYRFDSMFPFWRIQFAPACADNCAGVNAGIAAADFERLPDALTAANRTNETTIPNTRNCTSLFNLRTSSSSNEPHCVMPTSRIRPPRRRNQLGPAQLKRYYTLNIRPWYISDPDRFNRPSSS